MRACVALGLAVLCLAVASADRFSITVEPFARAVLDRTAQQDGTVYVSSSSQNFARDAELDNDLPTVLFDSSLQSWMDQQMGVIDALHSLFAPRSPCGGRASSMAMQDPSFAYMTSSRFSPALLTTYLEQVDDQDVLPEEDTDVDSEDQAAADEVAWSSMFETTGAEAMDRVRQFPDWLEAEEVQSEADEEAARRTLFAPGEPGKDDEQPSKDHHKGKDHKGKGKDKDHKMKTDVHRMKEGHEHGKHHKHHMASCKDMFTFAVLLVACVIVWGALLRTAVRCSKMIRKHKQRAARRSAVVEQNPLLAPLVREDSLHVPQVAVASYEVPAGSYYMPEGSNYVRVAYQPLSSE